MSKVTVLGSSVRAGHRATPGRRAARLGLAGHLRRPPLPVRPAGVALGVLLTLSCNPGALADASPFGLALGQARERDLTLAYALVPLGTHPVSRGPVYAADPADLGMTGATRATLVFDHRGVLQALLTAWPGGRFDELAGRLTERYQPVPAEPPGPDGTESPRQLILQDGDTRILMAHRWPALSLSLDYVQRRLLADTARASTRQGRAATGSVSANRGL